jgi:diacylglycerol kinase (ATP)
MAKPQNNTGLKRLLNAAIFSWQGFRAAFRYEEAFRQEVFILIIAIPLALWLGDSNIEKILLIGSIVLLMMVELLNSAIEAVVDLISDEWSELAGRAKDMGSAAVFLAMLNAGLTWVFILLVKSS